MNLPQEIISLIIEVLSNDFHSLQTLCLVSKSFLPDARRHLYRRIEIINCQARKDRWGIGPWEADFATGYEFLLTIIKRNPVLATYVRRFAYSANLGSRIRPGYDFWKLLMRALEVMVNLKCLCLENVAQDEHAVVNVLENNCSFQLTEFQWSDYSRRARPDQFHTIIRFLSSQPHLKYLALPTFQRYGIIDFPDAHCRELGTLVGKDETLTKILPGRSITKIVWWLDWHDDAAPPLFGNLHAELSSLETLVLKVSRRKQRTHLETLVPHLRSLKTFHLHGMSTLDDELENLAALPNLRTFIWSPRSWYGNTMPASVEARRALVLRWFGMVQTLETICFQNDGLEGGQGPGCQRWTRGADDPVDTSWLEVIEWYGWDGINSQRYYNICQ